MEDTNVEECKDTPQLSKNQQKRLIKREKYLEKKELHKQNRIRRKQPTSIRKKKKRVHISDYKVVLDLEFENLMTDKELASTIAQIQYCYADNRNRDIGLDLYCTSMSPNVHKQLGERCKDYQNWKMTFDDFHFLKHDYSIKKDVESGSGEENGNEISEDKNVTPKHILQKDHIPPKFCYLTADSPNELETLCKDTVYVIGAIVDHNRYKGLCFEKANELGIDHARLPIGKFVKMQSRKVLTINHVVGVLSEYINHHDWEQAFLQILPERKGAKPKLEESIDVEEDGKTANSSETFPTIEKANE
jgi:tRNA (guanine9-N1)-methyltransferase